MSSDARPTGSETGKPLVSVVVLNYRRRDELLRTIESIQRQTYSPRETVVVDNNSGDDSLECVTRSFPGVRVLGLTENLGCGGRNRGVEAARGELVVTLDNDVRFDSPDELESVVRAFERSPKASVLAFKILHEQTGKLHLRDWCHPRSFMEFADTEFETYYIPEGACAFRRRDFIDLGGYYEPFRIGGEGWDLALRLLDAGRSIVYCPEIRVRHSMATETRGERKPYYFLTRNSIWIALKDYTGWRRWEFVIYTLAKMSFYCLRPSRIGDFLRGLRDGFTGTSRLPRSPVSPSTWARLREISRHRPSWWTRLRTHWAHSEI